MASGQVLVIVGQHDHARYLSDGAIALTGAVDSGVEFTHVGFYSRAILPHVPLDLADHPNLQLSGTTSDNSAKRAKTWTAGWRSSSIGSSGRTRTSRARPRVLLLSSAESEDTVILPDPIKNTKQLSGKPVAWTIGPRIVPLAALVSGVDTTDDLDRRIENLGTTT